MFTKERNLLGAYLVQNVDQKRLEFVQFVIYHLRIAIATDEKYKDIEWNI
jgi:hypothetical protein